MKIAVIFNNLIKTKNMKTTKFNDDNSTLSQYKVLKAYIAGQKLTVQKCFREFGTTELRKINCRLREKGWDIRGKYLAGEGWKTFWLNDSEQIRKDLTN